MSKWELKIRKKTCLKLQTGDAFFWVFFSKCSWGSTIIAPLKGGVPPPVLIPSPLCGSKMPNNKISGMLNKKYYGHPATLNCYICYPGWVHDFSSPSLWDAGCQAILSGIPDAEVWYAG